MALENYGAASRWAARELGGIFTPREKSETIGLVAVEFVPTDNNRIEFRLTNIGTTNLTVSTDPAIVSGTGILLLGNGSSLGLNYREDADGVALRFYIVSDLAGGAAHLLELVQAFIDTGEEEE